MNYCTLFDHNYLSRGLALYDSLKKQCKRKFKLFVLAIDNIVYKELIEKNYKNIIVQSIDDIKQSYPVLNRLQKERTSAEFCWTLSSFSIQFFLKKYNLKYITYLDSDIYFFEDPKVLFDELGNESVIITPHNYTPKYDQSSTSGRYCVQFMFFRNDKPGNKVLEWWRSACEESCSANPVNGKFGDQKYLDDWLSRFPGIVHEEKHMGCGVAPWNVQQFDVENKGEKIELINTITKIRSPLIFYHFHGLHDYITSEKDICWELSSYDLTSDVIKNIYNPYLKKLITYSSTIYNSNAKHISVTDFEKDDSKIYIYGAGVLGKRCYEFLKSKGKTITGFVVSEKENNPSELFGYPVLCLNEIKSDVNKICLVVALKSAYKKEVLSLIKNIKFRKVLFYPEIGTSFYCFDTNRQRFYFITGIINKKEDFQIPFLSLKDITQTHSFELHKAIDNVVDSGWYLQGSELKAFETKYADYIGTKYCVGVGSGLDALELMFKSYKEIYKWEDEDEIIVPANTYIATIFAISNSHLKPILVEPKFDTLEIDDSLIEHNITPRTRGIIIVHLYGRCAYTEKIGEICKKYNLKLFEDNAQAHGCMFKGKKTGNLGDCAAHSFYPGKNLGAFGDAGAVTTNDYNVARFVRILGNYGSEKKYIFNYMGKNSRLDEIQAAVLNVKLNYIDEDNDIRKSIAKKYYEGINNSAIWLPKLLPDDENVYHIFPIFAENRNELQDFLSKRNINTLIHYPVPPHKQKVYTEWNHFSFPITEKIHACELSLPISPTMTNKEVEKVISEINKYRGG